MLMDITLIIPTIPPRAGLLQRMLNSVSKQTMMPTVVSVETDPNATGSAPTRNRALERVTTTWVTFADDDDILLPHHIKTLADAQVESGADVVYSWYEVIDGGTDPRPDRFNKPFDADELRRGSYIAVNSLVRTSLAKMAKFEWKDGLDDWHFYLRLLDLGAMFHHVPSRTFLWSHHGKNTSGKPWTGVYEA